MSYLKETAATGAFGAAGSEQVLAGGLNGSEYIVHPFNWQVRRIASRFALTEPTARTVARLAWGAGQ